MSDKDLPAVAASTFFRPELPSHLRSLIGIASRTVFPEGDEPRQLLDRAWVPPILTEGQRRDVQTAIASHRDYLAPNVSRDRIAVLIEALLEHYFAAFGSEETQTVVIVDWIDALDRFPDWAFYEARRRWLATETRRPVPADIVALCNKAIETELHQLAFLKHVLAQQPEAERLEAERQAEAKRAAERHAFLLEHPDWSWRDQVREAIADKEAVFEGDGALQNDDSDPDRIRRALSNLTPLPGVDHPEVSRWLREMGAEDDPIG